MEKTKKSRAFWGGLLVWAIDITRKSDRQLSQMLGRSDDYVGYSRRNRKKGPTLDDAFRLVEVIGLPDWVVFGRLFPPPSRPADLLEQLWKHAPHRLKGDGPPVAAPVAAELEDLGAGALADLALALATQGDTQRLRGDLDAAFRACHQSFDLAERCGERRVLAQCLWKGALLLADLGFAEFGLPWLDRAAGLFALDRQEEPLPELLGARGLLLLSSGRQEPGLKDLREAFARLPAGERRWRHAALWELAKAAQDAGESRAALHQLDLLARELEQERSLFQAIVAWRRAKALLGLEEKTAAIAGFGQAIETAGELAEPAAAVYLLCDAGEQLLRQGEAAVASQLASALLGVFQNQPPSRPLAEIVEDLYAIGRLRPLAESDIRLAQYRLASLHPQAGDFRLPRW